MCIRDSAQRVGPTTYQFELQFLNWSTVDAYAIVMTLNDGTDSMPFQGNCPPSGPFFSDAYVDVNGRPIFTGQADTPECPNLSQGECPGMGNKPTNNQWQLVTPPFGFYCGQICFSAVDSSGVLVGSPIAAPTATVSTGKTFSGLRDPDFDLPSTSNSECVEAINQMIPGSVVVGSNPTQIQIPDLRTVDNGCNVLDGFVIEVSNLTCGSQLSFNWALLDQAGAHIGFVDMASNVQGDPYGFGTFNITVICPTGGPQTSPGPLFSFNPVEPQKVNTGYDPAGNGDANIDSERNFIENEDPVTGIDQYRVNPIPAGTFGAGTYFAVEPGAAVSAPTLNPADTPPGHGSNLMKTDPGCGDVFLMADKSVIDPNLSLNPQGENQLLSLDAGPTRAGRLYVLLGTTTGPYPGQILGQNVVLPLNVDSYFALTLTGQTPFLTSSIGILDAAGQAQASLNLPGSTDLSQLAAQNIEVHHAAVVFDDMFNIDCTSNSRELAFVNNPVAF